MSGCALAAIGGSWGGTNAVAALLQALPDDFRLPVVLALHRSPSSDGTLVAALQRHTRLQVVEAEDKMALEPGVLVIAPADYHLLVEDGHLALSLDAPVRFSRPSIDVLFESAAEAYGERLVAVLLTGANDDGARGIVAVKQRGGRTYAQDPATAERPEMPAAAIATGAVDRVLPVRAIAAALGTLSPSETAS